MPPEITVSLAVLGLMSGVVLCIALGVVLGIALHANRRQHAGLHEEPERTDARSADAGRVRYFYLPPGGVPRGPTALVQLRAMLADGRLRADALAAPAGSDEWQPIETVVRRTEDAW